MWISGNAVGWPLGAAGWLLAVPLLLWAVTRTPWRRLAGGPGLHLLLGGAVALMVLWRVRAGLPAGPELHFLGLTAATLVLGPAPAVLAGALAALGLLLAGAAAAAPLGLNLLAGVALPVAVTQGLLRLARRRLRRQFFVYVMVNCFLAAGLAAATAVLAASALVALGGGGAVRLLPDYLALLPLLMLPEGLLNGMVVALLAAFRPEWVASFDPRRDLGGEA
ncbi:energy-coupling factor ABC transporter permease [Inmirania thermothiophila]|uniref:Putative membrane protein n=1 Tax=Inmirania thermothiophila TaxID=1750597 RepID=A0A3N1XX62_9GAMM|nr:energy-coupling factor ABC transporter permease [Inmirania thermothiophila]ROR29527.1 putative membrane protein [Inmirania thermothiophila]